MKNDIITSTKQLLADRLFVVLLSIFIIAGIAYCVYVASSLRVSDLQIAVHYTAFGMTNFYREKWYYLLAFLVFGIVMTITHVAVTAKIYAQERRQLALLFLGLSFLTMVVAWILTYSVLRIATL